MAQARTEFAAALNQIASEKGVDVSVVVDAIKQAALAAYKKDLSLRNEEIPEDIEEYTSEVDPVTGEISILNGTKNVTPPGFARIAASIARQVIMQKLHEAEKGAIMTEYENKVGTVISGAIQRQEGNTCFIDLGRAEGVMPPSEQVKSESYHATLRMKFLIKEIRDGSHGPEVILSRSDPSLVKGLFAMEVPEIQAGSVEIKVVAREAGSRTKIAAISTQDGVDPVGSLVGQKGVRVQQVMQELGDEKIDIISYSDDPARFIVSALSPAKDIQVSLDDESGVATVTVPNDQLSLAIGKGGQNVRLAAKLTGYKIDIVGSGEPEIEEEKKEDEEVKVDSQNEEPKVEEKAEDTETVQVEAETEEEGREKAESEGVDPEKTPEEEVVEAVEEQITEAEQEESKGGELEEVDDQPAEPQAAADAEADIAEEDAKESKVDEG
jgi:transcription termination/antitermination protein NusA